MDLLINHLAFLQHLFGHIDAGSFPPRPGSRKSRYFDGLRRRMWLWLVGSQLKMACHHSCGAFGRSLIVLDGFRLSCTQCLRVSFKVWDMSWVRTDGRRCCRSSTSMTSTSFTGSASIFCAIFAQRQQHHGAVVCFNWQATSTPAIGLDGLIVLQSAFDGWESGEQIANMSSPLQIYIEFGNCKVLALLQVVNTEVT